MYVRIFSLLCCVQHRFYSFSFSTFVWEMQTLCDKISGWKLQYRGCGHGSGRILSIAHAPFTPTLDPTLNRIEWPHKAPLFPRSQVDQHLTSSIEVKDAWTCICCNSECMVWWLFRGTTLTYPVSCVCGVSCSGQDHSSFFNPPISALHINLFAPKLCI